MAQGVDVGRGLAVIVDSDEVHGAAAIGVADLEASVSFYQEALGMQEVTRRTRDNRDEVLRQAGERIRACLRELDTVALLQESEFAILVNEIQSDSDPAHVARRMAEALAKPFTVGTQEITLSYTFYPVEQGQKAG